MIRLMPLTRIPSTVRIALDFAPFTARARTSLVSVSSSSGGGGLVEDRSVGGKSCTATESAEAEPGEPEEGEGGLVEVLIRGRLQNRFVVKPFC